MNKPVLLSYLTIILFSSYVTAQTTITLRPGPDEGKDALIHGLRPENNYGQHRDFMPAAWTAQGEPLITRSLIEFDLSIIPPGSRIVEARLSLYANTTTNQSHFHSSLGGSNEAFLRRILDPWDEYTVTWNKQPYTTAENQVWLHPSNYETEDYLDIDVTNLIIDMIQQPESSFGMMISLKTEIMYRALVFSSSDHENPDKWPKLVITYEECPLPVCLFDYTQNDNIVEFMPLDTNPQNCLWDFGDGYLSSLPNPQHEYQGMGDYIVCLSMENDCGASQWCDTVSVCQQATALFEYEMQGRTVIFTNFSENAEEYLWDMGTGFFTALENPIYIFEENGDFVVCLKAVNDCSESTFCDTIQVKVYEGVDEYPIEKPAKVFPNPFKEQITLIFPDAENGEAWLINSQGKIIIKQKFEGIDRIMIPTDFLDSGFYLLKIYSSSGEGSFKVVKL